jgi:hypothetical protein
MLDKFDHWQRDVTCSGENDPRCLPLHSFAPSREWSFDDPNEEKAFTRAHGKHNHRVDEADRQWRQPQPGGFHGRESLKVGGVTLRPGFHWDVQSSSNATSFFAIESIWDVPAKAYVNVHPDGHVSAGQSLVKTAGKSYVAPRPDPVLTGAEVKKTPKQVSKGRTRSRGRKSRGRE